MAKTVISDELRKEIYQHIKGHNKYKTNTHLDALSIDKLLCEVHPTYQDYYTNLIYATPNDD